MFTSIIVPLDLEREADRALPVADALAVHGGLRVELVTVSSPSMSEASDADELEQRARRFHAVCTTTVLHDNDVASALAAFAAERASPLVVMATRARGMIAEHVLGGVSEALLARSTDPILLLGPHAEAEDVVGGLTLVAGVDGTPTSEAVLSALAQWIGAFGGPAPWLVQVQPPVSATGDFGDATESAYVQRLAARLKERGIDAEWDVAHSRKPVDGLIDFADRVADAVLVVGSVCWTDPYHSHLRSVARALTRYAHHPVLVVPAARVARPGPSLARSGAMIPE